MLLKIVDLLIENASLIGSCSEVAQPPAGVAARFVETWEDGESVTRFVFNTADPVVPCSKIISYSRFCFVRWDAPHASCGAQWRVTLGREDPTHDSLILLKGERFFFLLSAALVIVLLFAAREKRHGTKLLRCSCANADADEVHIELMEVSKQERGTRDGESRSGVGSAGMVVHSIHRNCSKNVVR